MKLFDTIKPEQEPTFNLALEEITISPYSPNSYNDIETLRNSVEFIYDISNEGILTSLKHGVLSFLSNLKDIFSSTSSLDDVEHIKDRTVKKEIKRIKDLERKLRITLKGRNFIEDIQVFYIPTAEGLNSPIIEYTPGLETELKNINTEVVQYLKEFYSFIGQFVSTQNSSVAYQRNDKLSANLKESGKIVSKFLDEYFITSPEDKMPVYPVLNRTPLIRNYNEVLPGLEAGIQVERQLGEDILKTVKDLKESVSEGLEALIDKLHNTNTELTPELSKHIASLGYLVNESVNNFVMLQHLGHLQVNTIRNTADYLDKRFSKK